MHEDLLYMSAIELREAMRSKRISPVELMEQSLSRLERVEPVLNCFSTVMANEAMESAKNAEKAIMAGNALGPLHGLPVSIKDLVDVSGIKTSFGSRVSGSCRELRCAQCRKAQGGRSVYRWENYVK